MNQTRQTYHLFTNFLFLVFVSTSLKKHKVILGILMLPLLVGSIVLAQISSLSTMPGDYTKGFYIKGKIDFTTQICGCGNGGTGCCRDSSGLGFGPNNRGSAALAHHGYPMVALQSVSSDITVNGKVNDFPFSISDPDANGMYSLWVNTTGFYYTLKDTSSEVIRPNGNICISCNAGKMRISKSINCIGGVNSYYYANIDSSITNLQISDVRLWYVQLQIYKSVVPNDGSAPYTQRVYGTYWINLYSKTQNYNANTKKYSDITGLDFHIDWSNFTLTTVNSSIKQKSNCNDSIPDFSIPSNVIETYSYHSYNNDHSADKYKLNINGSKNGYFINGRKACLAKWNMIIMNSHY